MGEHWFPEKPCKGSGYRCIRINGKMDPVLVQAGALVGLPSQFLHTLFPSELTVWIDPMEVSYRIGENGSICVLYDEREVEETMRQSASSLTSTPNSSTSPSPSLSSDSSAPSSMDADPSGCKDSVRMEMEFMMDARNILALTDVLRFQLRWLSAQSNENSRSTLFPRISYSKTLKQNPFENTDPLN